MLPVARTRPPAACTWHWSNGGSHLRGGATVTPRPHPSFSTKDPGPPSPRVSFTARALFTRVRCRPLDDVWHRRGRNRCTTSPAARRHTRGARAR
eukprot:2235974-Rhodomonas_salina.1